MNLCVWESKKKKKKKTKKKFRKKEFQETNIKNFPDLMNDMNIKMTMNLNNKNLKKPTSQTSIR